MIGYISIYFDGALSEEHQFNTSSVSSDSYNFYLGTGQWLESHAGILVETFYNGNIDDFMFWNKSLTPDEIASYMFCPPDPAVSNLVGHWDFNEESSDVTNYTGGNNELWSIIWHHTLMMFQKIIVNNLDYIHNKSHSLLSGFFIPKLLKTLTKAVRTRTYKVSITGQVIIKNNLTFLFLIFEF